RKAGKNARFVPTGQTGIMIAGWGISVDRVISDFAPGAAEQLVLYAAHEGAELIFVEGQGAINHPAYAPVTLALMTGVAPDALILVCDPQRAHLEGFATPVMDYASLIALHELLLAPLKPAAVIGIALNTHRLSESEAREQIERARAQTLLPAEDVVRFGPERFYGEIAQRITKCAPLQAPLVT
ncbi:MAG: NAD-dependent epimerase/dehydratase family protein, partial [Candidatus Eremiobacteraeota bacterium]|nr:NAD-dependent epimerase/dehydratase family protein [Candidatus Eremiobacteraeota bacterium]